MRRIIFQMMVSLDGFYEGINREIDWHVVDEEFNEYAIDLLNSIDTLLFGRVTYELMADYWPTMEAIKNEPLIANKMNSLPKIVFSRSLTRPSWNNTRVVKHNIVEAIQDFKQQKGKDIALFGSSDMALNLIKPSLIDEFRIFINPVVLGNGKPLFKGIDTRLNFKLHKTKLFNSGLVLLYYHSD